MFSYKNFINFLIPFVIMLFIAVIIGLFFSYRQSNQVDIETLTKSIPYAENETAKIEILGKINHINDLGSQIWDYCGTETFKTITISVLSVLVLAGLGKLFKIEEAIDIRVRAQRQTRIDTQKTCISDSEKMWNDLYCMVSEVRFYDEKKVKEFNEKLKSPKESREKTIEDILKQCENFASTAEEVVNRWQFIFPKLPEIGNKSNKKYVKEIIRYNSINKLSDDEKTKLNDLINLYRRPSRMILFFVNMLYEAASSVAFCIKNNNGDTKTMQNSLGVVQDVTKDMVHQYMLAILKSAVEPLDGYGDEVQFETNKRDINIYLKGLFSKYIETRVAVYHILPLPEIMERDSTLKGNLRSYLDIVKKSPKADVAEKDKLYAQFNKSLKDINGCIIGEEWEYKYSTETLKDLAKELGKISINEDLEDRTKWLEYIDLFQAYD